MCDAGCIPHFAYQSLLKYEKKDRLATGSKETDPDGGIAFTWRNAHLDRKDHLMFELLGLDNKDIPDAYDLMRKMVVDDLVDDCKTLICPAKLMDDTYRVWCETVGKKRRKLPGEPEDPYEAYFENEYVDYLNPKLTYTDGVAVWDIAEDPDCTPFYLDLPRYEEDIDDMPDGPQKEQAHMEAYKKLLDE